MVYEIVHVFLKIYITWVKKIEFCDQREVTHSCFLLQQLKNPTIALANYQVRFYNLLLFPIKLIL